MTGVIATIPKQQFIDAAGNPAVGHKIYTYLAGSLTPSTTWQDQALTSANTNPIVLDAIGQCDIWLDSTKEYKFVLKTAADVIVWTVDDAYGAYSFPYISSAQMTFTNKTILAATNTVEATSAPNGSSFGFRNKIINGGFAVNQRGYVSGAAVGAGLYGHDRWKQAVSGDTYTFSTTANKTTVTIPAGKVLSQVIEGLNLQSGTYTLSWEGTAQGKIGAGALSASGVTGSITGGTDTTIEFGPGTVANIQLEEGSIATPFEQRPYGLELSLCQRYYEIVRDGDFATMAYSPTNLTAAIRFAVEKRAVPTCTSAANGNWVGNGTSGVISSVTLSSPNVRAVGWDSTSFTGTVVQGMAYMLRNADIRASAEL